MTFGFQIVLLKVAVTVMLTIGQILPGTRIFAFLKWSEVKWITQDVVATSCMRGNYNCSCQKVEDWENWLFSSSIPREFQFRRSAYEQFISENFIQAVIYSANYLHSSERLMVQPHALNNCMLNVFGTSLDIMYLLTEWQSLRNWAIRFTQPKRRKPTNEKLAVDPNRARP